MGLGAAQVCVDQCNDSAERHEWRKSRVYTLCCQTDLCNKHSAAELLDTKTVPLPSGAPVPTPVYACSSTALVHGRQLMWTDPGLMWVAAVLVWRVMGAAAGMQHLMPRLSTAMVLRSCPHSPRLCL